MNEQIIYKIKIYYGYYCCGNALRLRTRNNIVFGAYHHMTVLTIVNTTC